jgi:hypothetical protein
MPCGWVSNYDCPDFRPIDNESGIDGNPAAYSFFSGILPFQEALVLVICTVGVPNPGTESLTNQKMHHSK